MGIDATRKRPTEGFTRPWRSEILMNAKRNPSSIASGKPSPKNWGLDEDRNHTRVHRNV
jgi:hypothetical protein